MENDLEKEERNLEAKSANDQSTNSKRPIDKKSQKQIACAAVHTELDETKTSSSTGWRTSKTRRMYSC